MSRTIQRISESPHLEDSPHSPGVCVRLFREYASLGDTGVAKERSMLFQKLTEQTKAVIRTRKYYFPDGTLQELSEGDLRSEAMNIRRFTFTRKDLRLPQIPTNPDSVVRVHVIRTDHLLAAAIVSRLARAESTGPGAESGDGDSMPAVILQVHPKTPGGSFYVDQKNYTDGIEEETFRRTTLFNAFENYHSFGTGAAFDYNVPENGGVHVTSMILRGPEMDSGACFLREEGDESEGEDDGGGWRTRCAFMHMAPILRPNTCFFRLENYRRDRSRKVRCDVRFHRELCNHRILTPKYVEKLRERYRNFFVKAYRSGNRDLIIPGFGLHAAPPWHVALIVRDLLEDPKFNFKYRFRRIVFCLRKISGAKFARLPHHFVFRFMFRNYLPRDQWPEGRRLDRDLDVIDEAELRELLDSVERDEIVVQTRKIMRGWAKKYGFEYLPSSTEKLAGLRGRRGKGRRRGRGRGRGCGWSRGGRGRWSRGRGRGRWRQPPNPWDANDEYGGGTSPTHRNIESSPPGRRRSVREGAAESPSSSSSTSSETSEEGSPRDDILPPKKTPRLHVTPKKARRLHVRKSVRRSESDASQPEEQLDLGERPSPRRKRRRESPPDSFSDPAVATPAPVRPSPRRRRRKESPSESIVDRPPAAASAPAPAPAPAPSRSSHRRRRRKTGLSSPLDPSVAEPEAQEEEIVVTKEDIETLERQVAEKKREFAAMDAELRRTVRCNQETVGRIGHLRAEVQNLEAAEKQLLETMKNILGLTSDV